MKAELERICFVIDDILADHHLTCKIVGGYVSPKGYLLSLDDPTFINTQVRLEIKQALHVDKVAATIGTILISHQQQPDIVATNIQEVRVDTHPTQMSMKTITGVYEVVPSKPPPTVSIVTLMDDYASRHRVDAVRPKRCPLCSTMMS